MSFLSLPYTQLVNNLVLFSSSSFFIGGGCILVIVRSYLREVSDLTGLRCGMDVPLPRRVARTSTDPAPPCQVMLVPF